MIRLTLPGAVFRNVALLSTGGVFTSDYRHMPRQHTALRLWTPGATGVPDELKWTSPGYLLFWPNGERYLRAQGLWPDGDDLPTPIPNQLSAPPALAPEPHCYPFAFHPDGETAIFRQHHGPYGYVYHLRRADGSLAQIPTPSSGRYERAAFSHNGTRFAMSFGTRWGMSFSDAANVFYTDTLRSIGRFRVTSAAVHINTSPVFLDETRLVMAAGRSVCVWNTDARKMKTPRKLPAFRKFVDALAVSPDGRRMLAGDRSGEVRLYDGRTPDEIGRYDWQVGAVAALAFAPDGLTAAVAGADGVVVWDAE